MEIFGKGLLHFYQQASSLIGNKTNHKTNMFALLIQLSLWVRLCVYLYCHQWQNTQCSFKYFEQCTRGDQKVREKLLLNRIAFTDFNENS